MSTFSIIVPSLLLVSILHLEEIARDTSTLVIVPPLYHGPFENTPSIYYLYSNKPGQVNQRIYGALCSDTDYIILLDDDIYVSKKFINSVLALYANLLSFYEYPVLGVPILANKSTVSFTCSYPKFIIPILSALESTPYKKFLMPSSLTKLFYSTPHLSNSGDRSLDASSYHSADYISGGFSIIPSIVFPKHNYYPFSGKAFSEDIFLSLLLRKAHADLFISTFHVLYTKTISSSFSSANLKAKFYLLRYSNIPFKYLRFSLSFLVRSFCFFFIKQ